MSSYCTVDDVKLLLKFSVFKPNAQGGQQFSDPDIEAFIVRASSHLEHDFSTKIDFSKVPAPPDTPGAINDLAVFKTSELLLVALHGAQRSVENITDVMYWQSQYADLGKKIYSSGVILKLADGTDLYQGGQKFQNTDMFPPVFGDTKYGNWDRNAPDGFPDSWGGSLPPSPF